MTISIETREKISKTMKGKKKTLEHRQNISKAMSGHHHTPIGKNHRLWKGDDVGISALHNWVKRNLSKPKICDVCNRDKPLDLANTNGKYLRNLSDWQWLCRSCHTKSDNRILNIKHMVGKVLIA
jgi:hypothetical protein